MRKFIVFLVLLVLASSAFAQSRVSPAPVKVTAKSMRFLGNEMRSILRGDVLAISDQYTLAAEEVVVHLNNRNEITQIDCNIRVNFKSGDIIGTSDNAILNQLTQTVRMTGNVNIRKGTNLIEGSDVSIKYDTREIDITKGTITFVPDELNGISGMEFTPRSE
ncbi:MAG: hypothetical protein LBV04_09490 [Deferribacteraceae bacterium]|jgi:lipopolysaccharide export system protein LptA|nr:hypothetical protein [Deferribacteraceae bacterium]